MSDRFSSGHIEFASAAIGARRHNTKRSRGVEAAFAHTCGAAGSAQLGSAAAATNKSQQLQRGTTSLQTTTTTTTIESGRPRHNAAPLFVRPRDECEPIQLGVERQGSSGAPAISAGADRRRRRQFVRIVRRWQ
jgi:hypothetical protein